MPDIEVIAALRAKETEQPYMGWLDALSEGTSLMKKARLEEQAFNALVAACQKPKQFSLMVEAFDEYSKEHPSRQDGFQLLAEFVDDSTYGLSEWIEALEYFYDWLAQNERETPSLLQLLEYLSCCKEAGSSAPVGFPLQGLLEEMLDRYGYDGA
ncbi:hypothetical protein [Rubellicoccus peritrichatus]|uniref:Uncharacterized protein n=1 Tax=Rubellicoccus peritrichatus TaxID=3080537 RepID=A0AAQ3LEJ3_9BACT|nr:hypothetical protein [Puniceicoccus sp. CR14]WOO43104.1 hypothetical protein RZN69_08360 [Puniceicoccus sp. CR14]